MLSRRFCYPPILKLDILLCCILFCLVLLVQRISLAGQDLTMGAPAVESDFYGQVLKQIYTQAFDQLGLSLRYASCVPTRCAEYVERGILDGELARTRLYQDLHPKLIRVTESPLAITVSAYASQPLADIKDWKSLRNHGYRVGGIEGYYFFRARTKQFLEPKNVYYVRHWLDGLSLLKNHGLDVYVDVRATVDKVIAEQQLTVITIADLEQFDLYAYFHPNYKSIAMKVARQIKIMKKDGSIDKILKQTTASSKPAKASNPESLKPHKKIK